MPRAATPKAAEKSSLESWSSNIPGTVILRRLDHRGEMTRSEVVPGGRIVHLTVEERRVNQELAADESLDVFRNGTFTPVRLLDDDEEARELASNPNVMAESDMKALFKAPQGQFEERLGEMSNPSVLERLLRVANEQDASVSKVKAVQQRLQQVAPDLAREVQAASSSASAPGAGRPRAVTPR